MAQETSYWECPFSEVLWHSPRLGHFTVLVDYDLVYALVDSFQTQELHISVGVEDGSVRGVFRDEASPFYPFFQLEDVADHEKSLSAS